MNRWERPSAPASARTARTRRRVPSAIRPRSRSWSALIDQRPCVWRALATGDAAVRTQLDGGERILDLVRESSRHITPGRHALRSDQRGHIFEHRTGRAGELSPAGSSVAAAARWTSGLHAPARSPGRVGSAAPSRARWMICHRGRKSSGRRPVAAGRPTASAGTSTA